MTAFKYAGNVGYGSKSSTRRHKIQGVIVHHTATTRLDVVKRMFQSSTSEVSANAIGTPDGILQAVPENRRAWTSGSPHDGGKGADWDHRMATIETLNSTGAPGWLIAESTYQHVARWIAYLATKYGFTINRNTVIGHKELYSRYGASYPTACPGGIDLNKLVRLAKEYQTTDKELEKIMSWYKNKAQFEKAIADAVVRARVLTGLGNKDKQGKPVKENLAQSVRRGHAVSRQNRTKLDRIEAKLDKLLAEKDRE